MVSTSAKHPPTITGDNISGFRFTALLAATYGGFILLSAFAPGLLARPVSPGGRFTWAFAYGFSVMALGIVLTGVYVVRSNRTESIAADAIAPAEEGVAQ